MNIDKIKTMQKNVLNRMRHLTSYALWWIFISENEFMSKMSMADAKSTKAVYVRVFSVSGMVLHLSPLVRHYAL